MLLNILLTIQIIVAALLGVAVLLQRSEGGARVIALTPGARATVHCL